MDYMWIDNQKKQVRLPAPQYIGSTVAVTWGLTGVDFIMTNISNRISNEKVFPTKRDSSFPSNFHQNVIKSLHKQMFRVFAHAYWAHFEVCPPLVKQFGSDG
jgi:MOB kinase activator 1